MSAASQAGVDIEIIVVDDGSTDNTSDIVRRVCPGATLVRTVNRGASAARNEGLRLAHGEFIQFLDADDELAPGKLVRQAAALDVSGADVAYGDWERLERRGDIDVSGVTITRRLANPEIDLFTDFWCPPAVYLFTVEIARRVGGFKNCLPIIQDARFVQDCAFLGGRFEYCSGVMARYRVPSGGSLSTRDPAAFARDVFRNALSVEEWWSDHGGLDGQRKDALVRVLSYAARSSFAIDRALFNDVYEALMRLEPRYLPRQPRNLRLASRALGYRRAEQLGLWYRRVRSVAHRGRRRLRGAVGGD